jgi:hypothetical protein
MAATPSTIRVGFRISVLSLLHQSQPCLLDVAHPGLLGSVLSVNSTKASVPRQTLHAPVLVHQLSLPDVVLSGFRASALSARSTEARVPC